jgi:hypothetical protein
LLLFTTPGEVNLLDGIPVAEPDTFGEVMGLPDKTGEDHFIVSGMVGAALRGTRDDILVPGTGPGDSPIRKDGRIAAVTRLKKV